MVDAALTEQEDKFLQDIIEGLLNLHKNVTMIFLLPQASNKKEFTELMDINLMQTVLTYCMEHPEHARAFYNLSMKIKKSEDSKPHDPEIELSASSVTQSNLEKLVKLHPAQFSEEIPEDVRV